MEDFEIWIKDPNNNVEIKNWNRTFEKVNQLKASSTHFIADFDMTLTQYWDPETKKRSMSSHGALESWSGLSAEVKSRLNELYIKYYPMEISTTISDDEKRKAMEEWWEGAHGAIVEIKMSHSDIEQIVKDAKFVFRSLLNEFIASLKKAGIPLLVFSAGLGDIIEEILKTQQIEDVEIISNRMRFDSNGICTGFEEPLCKLSDNESNSLVHVLNKNEAAVIGPHATKIKNRGSVVLLGDSLGDLKMADGMPHDVKLTVGLLNHDYDTLSEKYLESFDIVLTNDTSLEFFIRLISYIEQR